jgi:hypothetical protein
MFSDLPIIQETFSGAIRGIPQLSADGSLPGHEQSDDRPLAGPFG